MNADALQYEEGISPICDMASIKDTNPSYLVANLSLTHNVFS